VLSEFVIAEMHKMHSNKVPQNMKEVLFFSLDAPGDSSGIFPVRIHLQSIYLDTIRYCCSLSGGNFLSALLNPQKS